MVGFWCGFDPPAPSIGGIREAPPEPPKAHSHTGGSSGKGTGQEAAFLAAGRPSKVSTGGYPHRYGGILVRICPPSPPPGSGGGVREAPVDPLCREG